MARSMVASNAQGCLAVLPYQLIVRLMDHSIAIWNLLHDGEIAAVSRWDTDLTLFVSIPYLRRRLAPVGASFVLNLKGVRAFEFSNVDGVPEPNQLDIGRPEILGTESTVIPVTVDTTLGKLFIDFDSVEIFLDTGQKVTFQTIEQVASEYWAEWATRAANTSTQKV